MRGIASTVFEPFPSYPQHFDKLMIPLFFREVDAHLWVTMIDSNHRIAELAEILATGLQRVLARQSSQNLPASGESSLHISPDQSGDAPPRSAEVPR